MGLLLIEIFDLLHSQTLCLTCSTWLLRMSDVTGVSSSVVEGVAITSRFQPTKGDRSGR